jgi:hypothetical protein
MAAISRKLVFSHPDSNLEQTGEANYGVISNTEPKVVTPSPWVVPYRFPSPTSSLFVSIVKLTTPSIRPAQRLEKKTADI